MILSFVSLLALASEHATFEAYMKANRLKCPGPMDTLSEPRPLTFAGKAYKHLGYRMEIENRDEDHRVVIGIISAIKDVSPATKTNLREASEWFTSAKAEWIIVNGDIALDEFDLEEIFEWLGNLEQPTIILPGNGESGGSFARAYQDLQRKFPLLVNGMWVRQIVADDVEFWIMPGYHDRRFVRYDSACVYREADVALMLEKFAPNSQGPVVLVSHGPPAGKGKLGIDRIPDGKNVGDPMLSELIRKASIPFGIFGHILEAGGQAVGKDMSTPLASGKKSKNLYLNAGSLSADPWKMNDGKTSTGMAILLTIDNGEASFEVKRFERQAVE